MERERYGVEEEREGITRRSFVRGASACAALTLAGFDPVSGTITGAFADVGYPEGGAASKWYMSVCPYCGVGCGVDVGVKNNRVVAVAGMKDHPVNEGRLCILGKNLVGMLHTDDRLVYPARREGDGFKRLDWDEAAAEVAERIKETVEKHGPDSFAMYVSASEYIEEYYIYNKFVKGCLGTNNLESSARLCWASGVVGLVKAFGADSPPCAYEDVELADLVVLSGYNPSSSKPIFFRRLVRAKKDSGARLIVIDPRRTDTARFADTFLQIRPGTDVLLHNAMAHVLIKEKLIDEAQARRLTDDYDAFSEHVKDFAPERVAAETGLSAGAIRDAARQIGRAERVVFMWGQGLNQSRIGTRKVTTLLNLCFITGNIGRPGAGPLAITGQTSAMGLREVGALPHLLPGFRLVTDGKAREEVARVWGVDPAGMSPNKGKPIPMILEGLESGRIKVLWIIHSNPAATFPDTEWARRALSKADFLIVQDCYHPTETSRYAHMLLPGAQWSEKGGTLTNSERGLNLIEKAVDPPGQARPDLLIVMDVARRMGFGDLFRYRSTEDIFEEYKLLTRGRPCDISGLTYARIAEEKGIQWPVPTAGHKGTRRRFLDRRFPKGKLRLNLHDHEEPAETPGEGYPLHLITGLVATQYHSRTRTGKIVKLDRTLPEPFVEIHPDDAGRYGVADGDLAVVSTRRGSVKARVVVTDGIRRGAIFVPYHFGYLAGRERAVNALTNRSFDEFAKQPEFKAAAARIEKA
ncbi:MAG TPA: nitrate reductase catalytic subunit [Deltaproteobacteria bacterium]|nr:nitrate reductase catalytic subunit [Deltaproteobacteria bacterium]